MNVSTKRKTYTSLFISEEKLQIIRLDKKKEKVIALAEAILPEGIVSSGEVTNPEKLGQAVASLFQSAKLKDRFVVVGIPENKSYTKVLTLPKLKEDELNEALTWEAESYLPVAIEQVYMDWKIIGETKNKELRILLIAVPKEIIDKYSEALQRVRLIPIAFETTALSLVRLIEHLNVRAIVLDIRKHHAVLTLSKGKEIQASSIVPLSGNDINQELKTLTQTINKMVEFYDGKNKEEDKIKSIFISGENLTQELLTQLANGTQKEVKPCPISVKNLPQNQQLNFAVTSALAMKEIASPDDEDTINLLPPIIQLEFDNLRQIGARKRLLSFSTITILLTTIAAAAALIYLETINTSLLQQKLQITLPPPETAIAIQKTNQLNKSAKTVVEIDQKRKYPQERLVSVLPVIPQGIKIISISIDETQLKLRIVGRATKRGDLLTLRDEVEKLDEVKEAVLPLSSLQKAENIDFVLTANLKGNG